ncbi:hypothetical protein Ple7327_0364 [Pleurocapsa sp. PCC 7327]|nr:DUF427 domain-containing protein [Pleurocapsa sp. PCC 7327]AFY75825.1 hypothetical protein Ple7327_0364 [Pleurocapsa sp. PCC 7327]
MTNCPLPNGGEKSFHMRSLLSRITNSLPLKLSMEIVTRHTILKVVVGDKQAVNAAWYYPNPTPAFASLKGYVAFYPSPMDACYVDGEQVTPQPGDFYGGWITSDIVGPFKGSAGSWRS